MREKRVDIFKILKNEGKLETLYVYQSREVEVDPYEHRKALEYTNPLPIKALIRQISFEALRWKFWGQVPMGSIEVIVEKKNKTLLRTADKIKYGEDYYKCWKDDSKGFAILERPDYIILILEKKALEE